MCTHRVAELHTYEYDMVFVLCYGKSIKICPEIKKRNIAASTQELIESVRNYWENFFDFSPLLGISNALKNMAYLLLYTKSPRLEGNHQPVLILLPLARTNVAAVLVPWVPSAPQLPVCREVWIWVPSTQGHHGRWKQRNLVQHR